MPDIPPRPAVRSRADAARLVEQLGSLFDSPELYPAELDETRGTLGFVPVERSRYRELSFHAVPWLREQTPDALHLSTRGLLDRLERRGAEPPVLHLVLHHCFSGSTLLSRAIEEITPTLAVREPGLLQAIAAREVSESANPDHHRRSMELLDLALALLARHYPEQTASVVKANDGANLILTDLLDRSRGRGIFIHTDLATHVAVATKHADRREWVRGRGKWIAEGRFAALGMPDDVGPETPEPRLAAALWVAHTRAFRRAFAQMGPGRLASIDLDRLLAAPEATLERALEFLGLPRVDEADAALAAVLGEHAKLGGSYDRKDREAELERLRARDAAAITDAVAWAVATFGDEARDALPGGIDEAPPRT